MSRVAAVVLAALALAPASAGAGATRPALALTATPARIALAGAASATLRVANPGASPVVVDVGRAGFTLDPRGRPRLVPHATRRAATAWLTVRPTRLLLPAGSSRLLTVTSRPSTRAEPGDHDALVLLTTRPRRGAGVAVRMRIGVVVVVRAPGRVVRRLSLGQLRVRRLRHAHLLELVLVNRGNVTEALGRGVVLVRLERARRHTTLRSEPRELRPRTRGVLQLRYRGRLAGWVTARVRIAPEQGRAAVGRTYHVPVRR
jgi:hypothetical protein